MKVTTAEQLVVIGRLWVGKKVPIEQTQKILDSGFLSDLCDGNLDQVERDDFRQLLGLSPFTKPADEEGKSSSIARPVFRVAVDYRQTLADMITVGHYNWVDSNITAKHFPVKGEGEQSTEITLFHFDQAITSEAVVREMDQAGYRPAKIEELLSLGAAQPDLQREFPIIELGSVWVYRDGNRFVASLARAGSERELVLHWFDDGWVGLCRFAAVRK